MKHTEGPWKVSDDEVVGGMFWRTIALIRPLVEDRTGYDIDHTQANAELIAKAPEMYDRLASARAIMQRFVAFMDEYYSIRGVIEPVKSDTEEDRLLKKTYAEMKQWMEDERDEAP